MSISLMLIIDSRTHTDLTLCFIQKIFKIPVNSTEALSYSHLDHM